MAVEHHERPQVLTPSAHYTGKSPSTDQLNRAYSAFMHGMWYKQHSQLAQFSGPPSDTYNGGSNSKFYTIFPSIEPPGPDGKIRIGADVRLWDEYGADVVTTWDGGTSTTYDVTAASTQAEGERPEGLNIFESRDIDYDQNAADGYGFTRFNITNVPVAHFSSFTMPRHTLDLQESPELYAQQYYMKNDTFNIGQSLRGCSTYGSVNGSVGALVQHQNSRDAGDASLVNTTRRCIFQWSHPAGAFFPATASTRINFFGAPVIDATTYDSQMKVRGRGLLNDTSKKMDLVIIGRWDTHTAELNVKITSSLGNATYYFPNTGQTGTVAMTSSNLCVSADFLDFDPTGDELKIEVQTATAKAIEIKTIALFEAKD